LERKPYRRAPITDADRAKNKASFRFRPPHYPGEEVDVRFSRVLTARGDPNAPLEWPDLPQYTHVISPIEGRRLNRRSRVFLEDMELKSILPIVLRDGATLTEPSSRGRRIPCCKNRCYKIPSPVFSQEELRRLFAGVLTARGDPDAPVKYPAVGKATHVISRIPGRKRGRHGILVNMKLTVKLPIVLPKGPTPNRWIQLGPPSPLFG